MSFQPKKLKSGTLLPLISLKGKPYMQVAHRLVWFREEHPDWGIETEMVDKGEGGAIFKSKILNESGRVIAMAHKTETKKGFPDFIEKAETGSIGRALALCGYGTQFEPELDEGDRLADAPVELTKKDQVVKAGVKATPVKPQPKPKPAPAPATGSHPSYIIKFGKFRDKDLNQIPYEEAKKYAEWLRNSSDQSDKPLSDNAREFIGEVDNRNPAKGLQDIITGGVSDSKLDEGPAWDDEEIPF